MRYTRLARRRTDEPGVDFLRLELQGRVLYLRRDLAAQATAIFAALNRLDWRAEGMGNRASSFRLALPEGPELFARLNRRGGLARYFVENLYLGVRARPARELALAAEARRRGIPVAEAVGALVEWIAPIAYRGILLTRALPGMTLWEFVRTDEDPDVRAYVMEQARQAIGTMHRLGLVHADLNLRNLFVTQSRESFAIVIIDLDQARLYRGAVAAALRGRDLARLRRSVRKLDPDGRYIDARSLELLSGT